MISIYTLTSSLHDEKAVDEVTAEFLGGLGIDYSMKGSDFSTYGEDVLSLIYVRTGGTENIFKSVFGIVTAVRQPVYLLTSGKSNSLAASMEILSYLRGRSVAGEILHGSPEYVGGRIERLLRIEKARRAIDGKRLGVIGRPSDWLISSACDYDAVKKKTGIEIIDIPIDDLVDEIKTFRRAGGSHAWSDIDEYVNGTKTFSPDGDEADFTVAGQRRRVADYCRDASVRDAVPGAMAVYHALRHLVERYSLSGLTLRCFDLLGTVGNTGCLALAKLNAEGVVSSCEGDIPALLSMVIAQALTGKTGFQANPSRIDPETGEMVFAHCTVPFNMLDDCAFDTHFESGIGVGIKGRVIAGPATVFKVSGSLDRFFAAEGGIERNLDERDLCRTQIVVKLASTDYFLGNPIGNHHIIVPGRHADVFSEFMRF